MKVKVCHIITGLTVGGAESMLYKLLKYSDKGRFESIVISLSDIGPIGEKIIKDCAIEVYSLGMRPNSPSIKKMMKLVRLLKEIKPDLIQSWMYHSDLIALIASKLAGIKPVIWGIHHSDLSIENNKRLTIAIAKICSKLSGLTSKIVCCSNASYDAHEKIGYSKEKMIVIPNGFELSKYKPNSTMKEEFLGRVHIEPNNDIIFGTVGRWDVLKDYPNLINAADILVNKKGKTNFKILMCGNKLDKNNGTLKKLINDKGLGDYFELLGRRDDIHDFMAAIDYFILSSKGEGFPNVLGEAMACETPCITTDVGDSAYIVENTGLIVRPSYSEDMAVAMVTFMSLSNENRVKLGVAARKRIQESFEIGLIVKKYEDLYLETVE